jgi:hypothetical protein
MIEFDIFHDQEPARRGRPAKVLRQPLGPTSEPMKKSDSWWITASAKGFTDRAERERQRMSGDVIGRKVPDQILGRYIGLVRPTE